MLKIINGTFVEGNAITIHDTNTDKMYHKIVFKNSVEINGILYYKDDFSLFACYETGQTMNKKEWFLYYLQEVDKTEYKDFSEWWHDMTAKSHVLEEVK